MTDLSGVPTAALVDELVRRDGVSLRNNYGAGFVIPGNVKIIVVQGVE